MSMHTSGSSGDGYASAADLVERSAAAQVSGIPEQRADDGFFGPSSVTWRISGDATGVISGLRSLLMQALHPLAMAGVDQHSGWREDPVGRLAATTAYLAAVTFGDRAVAEQVSAQVRRIHEHVRGVDTVTGQLYSAGDPALLLWVHAAFVDSGIAARELFGSPLSPADADRHVAEMVVAGRLVGIPEEQVPASAAALAAYIESVRPELRRTTAAAESMAYMLNPPGLDEDVAEIWQDVRAGAVASLPGWARDLYGYDSPPLTPARQAEIRQALGVLDAVYLGEPGVLEARQRIALWVRAAQRPAARRAS
jgi:uncharacterized protein (DUF2236 family)